MDMQDFQYSPILITVLLFVAIFAVVMVVAMNFYSPPNVGSAIYFVALQPSHTMFAANITGIFGSLTLFFGLIVLFNALSLARLSSKQKR